MAFTKQRRRAAGAVLFACAFILGVFTLPGCAPREGDRVKRGEGEWDVQMVNESNAAMNAAFAESRKNLPKFVKALQNPRPGQTYLVKVRLTDGTNTEYLWLKNLTYDGKQFRGELVDNPYQVKGYHSGQVMTPTLAETFDWGVVENGVIVDGGYTERVLENMNPQKP